MCDKRALSQCMHNSSSTLVSILQETTSSGQAFPERNHAKTEANDTNEESHKSVSAVNKQSDDIYGPAYEFD